MNSVLRAIVPSGLVTAKTHASGQFVFVVDHPGTFIVEILSEESSARRTEEVTAVPVATQK